MDLYNEQKYEEALKVFFENPNDENNYYIGMCYYHLRGYKKALEYLKKCTNIESCLFRGHLYKRDEKYRLAIEEYQKIPDEHTFAMIAHYHLGFLNSHFRKHEDAEKEYEKVLELKDKMIYDSADNMYVEAKRSLAFVLLRLCKYKKFIKLFDGKLNDPNNDIGYLPLELAIEKHETCLIFDLIKLGADPFQKDKNGWTPFYTALNQEHINYITCVLHNYLTMDQNDMLHEHQNPRKILLLLKKFYLDNELDEDVFEKIQIDAIKWFKNNGFDFEKEFYGRKFKSITEYSSDADIELRNGDVLSLNTLIKHYKSTKKFHSQS